MSLEVLLRLSVLRGELLGVARDLPPEQQRIIVHAAGVLGLLRATNEPESERGVAIKTPAKESP